MLTSLALADSAARVPYLYNLSGFSGTIPFNHVRLFVDRGHDEIYVADGETIRIFNASGMETYRFGDGQGLGAVLGLAVDENGDIFILSYDPTPVEGVRWPRILQLDYRGEPKAEIEISGLPDAFAGIRPNAMFRHDGLFWLVSRSQLLAVALDASGTFRKGLDFGRVLEIPEAERSTRSISGVGLDPDGNFLLTVSVMFRVFVVSQSGEVVGQFGKVGSAPGLFGVVSGIDADDRGNVYVADRLRSVVMVFDSGYQFITEFGYMGKRPENLVRPADVAIGNGGRLYVTQSMNRGVSVFSVASRGQ